jgi:hypothetical protein
MTLKRPTPGWQRKGFLLRVLLSYVVIPVIPPVLLLARTRGSSHIAFGDWLGILLLYSVFGFAAMVVLGTPLLFFYLRLGWTGFLAFMAGGGLCAAITSYAVLRGQRDLSLVEFFAIAGIIAGLLFRVILFGIRRQIAAAESSVAGMNGEIT